VSKLKAIIDSAKRAGVDKSQPPPQMPDEAARQGIRAYHGSPHSFDKFSTSQIGTGEGAQAYGRGLYFAEREKTAKGYRDALKGRMVTTSDGVTKTYGQHITEVEDAIRAAHPNLNPDNIRAAAKSVVDDNLTDADVEGMGQWEGVYKSGIAANKNAQASKGSMYEVNIAATPDEFIDWDLPLDEQSESVMNALNKTDWYQYAEEGAYNAAERRGDNAYGMDLVRWLEEDGAEDAAKMLKDAGIKGIQYADAQTRFGKGPKTKNYVVYDDKLISISKKYGISIPAAAAVLAGTMTPEEAQAGPGAKALAELAKRAGAGDQAAVEVIRAYHGSPHDFPPVRELEMPDGAVVYQSMDDAVPEGARVIKEHPLGRFDMSKIGTGEGAQAYGRGLYFAEAENVAKGYRQRSGVQSGFGNYAITDSVARNIRKRMTEADESGNYLAAGAIDELLTGDFSPDQIRRTLQEDLDVEGLDPTATLKLFDDAVQEARSFKGSMYEVDIDATPDEFLDYNKPINQQSEYVRAALERAGINSESSAIAGPMALEQESQLLSQGIKGIKYAEGNGRGTSNYVVFDDKLISIAKKYGVSIPIAAYIAEGIITPEEAQAGVISIPTQGIRSLGQTLEFDPRFDPRKREQEGLQSLQFDFLPRNEAMIKPSLRLSDLEGEDFVTSMSDRTRAGGMIMGINGVPLYRAVDLRGGQDFMFENPNQVWASARVPSEKILEMAREFQGQSGKDPLFIPWRMAPTGGDFSNMVGELMLGFASSNMDKATKKAFDVAIREYKTKGSMDKGVRKNAGLKIKEWPGVDDPKAVEIWRSTPDAVRKELMNMMDVQFRNKGGLSIGSARLVASDPTQLMSRDAGLQNVGRIYTGQDITPSTHPSYPYAVPGEGIGTLKGADEVTIFDLLPEARFGDAQKKVKDPANPTQQEIRALQMKPYGGTITENILRRIEERGVNVNSLTGLTPGALAFTLTSAGLLTPEEAAAGGLDEAAEIFSGTKGGNQGLVPFDKDIHTSRDVGLGGLSSEYTMTVDAPDGQVAVIPSIWWDTNGEPVVLDQRDAERRSFEYEQETGKQFPRFPAGGYELADEYAQARTRQGGASESPLASEYPSLSGMGVTSRAMPDEVAFKAPREPRRIPEKQPPGIASLAGQLGLGAMSEIGGAILGGLSGVGEYVRGGGLLGVPVGAPATGESIRNINEGVSGYVGDLYDAGPEAQALGQQIMQGIGETIAPIAEYAMEGDITDEYGINMLPLIAQKLGIPLYELLERVYSMMPEREQEALKSGADAFL
jgi:hypothetical protein